MKKLYWTLGLTVSYFALFAVVAIVCLLVLRSPNMVQAPAIIALFAAPIYALLLSRVGRFGAITLVGLVLGAFFYVSGHFAGAALPNIICAVLADYIASRKNYQDKSLNLLSYIIFSLGNVGPLVTMWLAPDAYAAQLLARGKDIAYVNQVMLPFNAVTVIGLFASIIIAAVVGNYLTRFIIKD